MSNYIFHILVQSCLTAALATSLNLLAGYCGLVSLGQLTFFALGAYSAALVAPATSFGYVLVWPVALGSAWIIGTFQAAVTSNLKDDEFAIATFAMHSIFWMLLMNWVEVTRGPLGIAGIPPFHFFGFVLAEPSMFLLPALLLLAGCLFTVWKLLRAPFGMAMRLVRDDEELAKTFGRDVKAVRRSALVVAALMAAMAGILQAAYVGYIHPISFSSMESTLLLAVVIIGGVGSFWGPVTGALVLTVLPEVLRFLGLPAAQAANIRQIILGVILVVVVFHMRVMKQNSLFHAAGATR